VKGSTSQSGDGAIYRDSSGVVMGYFSAYFGIQDVFFAQITAAMLAIKIARNKSWHSLWLQCPLLGTFGTIGRIAFILHPLCSQVSHVSQD